MSDLAGNSFVAFQFLAVVLSVLTHWPALALKPSDHDSDHEDEDAFLATL